MFVLFGLRLVFFILVSCATEFDIPVLEVTRTFQPIAKWKQCNFYLLNKLPKSRRSKSLQSLGLDVTVHQDGPGAGQNQQLQSMWE